MAENSGSRRRPDDDATALLFEKLVQADQIPQVNQSGLWAAWAAFVLVGMLLVGVVWVVFDNDKEAEEIRLRQSTDLVVQTLEARFLGTAELLQKTSMRLMPMQPMGALSRNPRLLTASAELAATTLMNERREVLEIAIVNDSGIVEQAWTSGQTPAQPHFAVDKPLSDDGGTIAVAKTVLHTDSSAVTNVYARKEFGRVYANVVSPMPSQTQVLVARIDVSWLLADAEMSAAIDPAYSFHFLVDGQPLMPAHSALMSLSSPLVYTAAVNFLGHPSLEEVMLEGVSFEHKLFSSRRLPYFLIIGLGLMLLTAVGFLFYYQRRQHGAHQLLSAEYSLRRAMSESAVVGLRVTDTKGRILYVNETFQRIVGWPAQELLGLEPPFPYWTKTSESPHGVPDGVLLEDTNRSAGPIFFEARRKNGERFYAEVRLSPLFDGAGNPLGIIGALYDVTESFTAKLRLEEANERFACLMDALVSVIVVLEEPQRRRILFANRAYQQKAERADWLLAEYEKHREKHLENDGLNGLYDPETRRWWEIREQPVTWTKGEPAVILIMGDITTRRELEIQREEQKRRAESTQRLVTMGEMASSLAHELNQPLAAIANYAGGAMQRLEEKRLTAAAAQTAYAKIESLAQRAGKIILRIRGFTKKTDPVLEPVSVDQVIQETMELASIQARNFHAQVTLDVPEHLPLVFGDAVMLEQLLLNLIKNALEAEAENGTRTVEVRVRQESKADGTPIVSFLVIDHGPGIPQDIRAKLFDAFYSTKNTGMGMGLNICRSIAEVHGSRIEISDTPGGGTTFRFTVRLAQGEDAGPQNEPAARPAQPLKADLAGDALLPSTAASEPNEAPEDGAAP